MATVEKSNLKTEAYFSEDKKHRFLLRKQWDSKKPSAMILMINPSNAEEIVVDHTTMFTINNLSKLGYGNVDILNMFSKVGTKLRMGVHMEELTVVENDDFILKSAEKADIIVIAWGKGAENSKRVAERQTHLIQLLSPFKDKLHQIGEFGYHPLVPQVRNEWNLMKFNEDVFL